MFKFYLISVSAIVFILSFAYAQEEETRASGLKIIFVEKAAACEKEAKNGDMLTMHYRGTLESDGTQFDSSYDRSEPFKFQIGVGQVIKGWEEGVLGMCVGEKRKLIVPPELGYGEHGAGDLIPAGATLVFEIELMDTEAGPAPVNVFKQIDGDADNQLSREELSSYLQAQMEEMKANGGSEAEQQAKQMESEHDKLVEEIFEHEDKDKDGFISHAEFSGPKHDEL